MQWGRRLRSEVAFTRGLTRVDRVRARHWLARVEDAELMVARADGSDARPLLTGPPEEGVSGLLAWSPDGRTLYHEHDQLHAIDVATGQARALTARPPGRGIGAFQSLLCSPDNRVLLFVEGLREPEPGTLLTRRLRALRTDGAGSTVFAPFGRWGPWLLDANWERDLLVTTVPAGPGRTEFRTMDAAGGDRQRVAEVALHVLDLALSPDGAHLAVALLSGLALLDLTRRRWTDLGRAATNVAWSPDGTQLAFMNDESELWLLRPGGEKSEFTALARARGRTCSFSARGGSYTTKPHWSPDGRLLWFGLARTRRVAPDPELARSIEEADFSFVPKVQRAECRQASLRQLQWRSTLWSGIVDFAEHQVCLHESWPRGVAWSPLLDAPLD